MGYEPLELWADHRRSMWASAARRGPNGQHLGYVTVERPYWGAYEQITVNNDQWLNFIVVDVDGRDAVQRIIDCPSPPSWVVRTPHGAHAGWVIDSVKTDRVKAVRYFNAVRENLRRVLDGDPGYTGHGTRNPLYRDARVWWGNMTLRKLGQIHQELNAAGIWTSDIVSASGEDTGAGRNTRINRALWRWATSHPHDLAQLQATADLLNAMESPPLDSWELAGIVASVERGLGKPRKGGGPAWPTELAQRGGRARAHAAGEMGARSGEARQQKSNILRNRAHALRDQGLTQQAIADQLGITTRSVRTYLKTPPPPIAPSDLGPRASLTSWGLFISGSREGGSSREQEEVRRWGREVQRLERACRDHGVDPGQFDQYRNASAAYADLVEAFLRGP